MTICARVQEFSLTHYGILWHLVSFECIRGKGRLNKGQSRCFGLRNQAALVRTYNHPFSVIQETCVSR